MSDEEALEMWTVYRAPRDYPDKWVARKSMVMAGVVTMTSDMLTADTLGELRRLLPPGLSRIPRYAGDDPVIWEVWI